MGVLAPAANGSTGIRPFQSHEFSWVKYNYELRNKEYPPLPLPPGSRPLQAPGPKYVKTNEFGADVCPEPSGTIPIDIKHSNLQYKPLKTCSLVFCRCQLRFVVCEAPSPYDSGCF